MGEDTEQSHLTDDEILDILVENHQAFCKALYLGELDDAQLHIDAGIRGITSEINPLIIAEWLSMYNAMLQHKEISAVEGEDARHDKMFDVNIVGKHGKGFAKVGRILATD